MRKTYASGIDYMVAHVQQYRTFSAPGHQTGDVIKQCTRGILPREVARYPDLEGKVFFFNWDRTSNTVLDPLLLTHAQVAALHHA